MRHAPSILLTLTLGVALAACGPFRADGPQVDPPVLVDPPAPGQPFPVDPGAQASQVEPVGGTVDPRPVSWESAEVLDGGDRVELAWTSGVAPCYQLDRIEVIETDEVVTVTLFEGSAPSDGPVACIEIAQRKTTIAHLGAPVGARSLVDGADEG